MKFRKPNPIPQIGQIWKELETGILWVLTEKRESKNISSGFYCKEFRNGKIFDNTLGLIFDSDFKKTKHHQFIRDYNYTDFLDEI